jgi:CRISPR/Cas system CMR-associated protein Cmr5 small subunit
MKKKVEKYVPAALEAVRKVLAKRDATNKPTSKVYEEYDGYAASFGASVVTSGLLPTLSFYTDVHKDDKNKKGKLLPRRYRILQALAHILQKHEHQFEEEDTPASNDTEPLTRKTAVLDFAIGNPSLKKDILAASIALKLALRNFEHIKSPASHES